MLDEIRILLAALPKNFARISLRRILLALRAVAMVVTFCLICTRAEAQCTVTAGNVAFGNVDILSASPTTTTATIGGTCPGGFGSWADIWVCIAIGVGANSSSVNNRTMKSGSNTLSYELYTDSGFTNVYPFSPPFQFAVPYSNSTGATLNSTVYAKVFGSQTAPPGTYTDSYAGTAQANVSGNVTNSLPGTCSGGTQALTFTVSATIAANCNVSASTLNFGSSPSSISANIDATATVTLQCSNTTPYAIGLGNGANASGSQRRLAQGVNFLNYGLYIDSARSQPWTSTTSATSCSNGTGTCVLGTGTGSTQSVSVYGRVPAQTATQTGTFSDTVVMTVTF